VSADVVAGVVVKVVVVAGGISGQHFFNEVYETYDGITNYGRPLSL